MIDYSALELETRGTKYPGKPFGYEYNMDMRQIEDQMIADGILRGTSKFIFEGSRLYEQSKRHELTFGQRQDLAKWLGLGWAGGSKSPSNKLTEEELEYIYDRIHGANDPIGQSILTKIKPTTKSS
jgi:hypothetical protein